MRASSVRSVWPWVALAAMVTLATGPGPARACDTCNGHHSGSAYPTGGDQGGGYALGGDQKFTSDVPPEQPLAFALRMRSANPLRGPALFEFDLPRAALVTVKFFDVQGRVAVRAAESRPFGAGTHRLEVPTGRLASGQYLCRLSFRDAMSGALQHEQVLKILRLR